MFRAQLDSDLGIPACSAILTCQTVRKLSYSNTVLTEMLSIVSQVLQLANQLQGRYNLMGIATSPMAFLGLIWIMLKVVKSVRDVAGSCAHVLPAGWQCS